MSELKLTLIDVGWGDSIFVEAVDDNGEAHYALIDSNDTTTLRSSYIFLRRYFDRTYFQKTAPVKPVFDWALVTHAHADHAQGLKRLISEFGTNQFWFPDTQAFFANGARKPAFVGSLMNYVRKSRNVVQYGWISNSTALPNFGPVTMQVLWPPPLHNDANENNNSVVIALTLDRTSFVLTGDAEADVWSSISSQIPSGTLFFKHPHHGSDNGMFDVARRTPWLSVLANSTQIGISSHVRPFPHPSQSVVNELNNCGFKYYRTDQHHHITITTDGSRVSTEYTHG